MYTIPSAKRSPRNPKMGRRFSVSQLNFHFTRLGMSWQIPFTKVRAPIQQITLSHFHPNENGLVSKINIPRNIVPKDMKNWRAGESPYSSKTFRVPLGSKTTFKQRGAIKIASSVRVIVGGIKCPQYTP